jgi:drug/metabolite transporter (DMT)-like permease
MWLFFTLLGCLLLAIVNILDKFLVTKKVSPAVFVFYSTVIALPIFLLVPFGVEKLHSLQDWFLVSASGIAFGVALWCMYVGFKDSEVSHIGPLVGASISFFVVVFSQLFLAEPITTQQVVGIAILMVGSLLISFEKSHSYNGWHVGMLWGILAGVFFGFSNVLAKHIYTIYGFWSGFVWTRAFTGVIVVVLIFFPSVYKLFLKTNHRKQSKEKSSSNLGLIGLNKTLGILGVLAIQYATAIGSVSLVNALTGVQYGILVVLIALLSKFAPRTFKETYTKKEIVQESVAIFFIVIGLIVLM